MAAEASGGEAVASARRPLSFLDLPTETPEDIISHVSFLLPGVVAPFVAACPLDGTQRPKLVGPHDADLHI